MNENDDDELDETRRGGVEARELEKEEECVSE